MKILLANQSQQTLGGGWTFLRNFEKYAKRQGIEIIGKGGHRYRDTIILISGATMIKREFIETAKHHGAKIVLRVDNIPRNSRNRNTGTSRLYDFAQLADLVIYQSDWAKNYIAPFLKKDGPVILNGADHEIFHPDGPKQPNDGQPQYLYVRYNRDETKEWHQVWYQYQMWQRRQKYAHLWIVGNFSQELQQYNFDFYDNEKFRYIGVLDKPEDMAEYYRGADEFIYSYFNDACSNTLIEALLCGTEICLTGAGDSGAYRQIIETDLKKLTADYMTKHYLVEIEKIL